MSSPRKLFTPRPYQELIIQHTHNVERCAVWAGMGMGKTSSTLNALDHLFLAGEDHPTLVLAPLRVARTTWPEEARKWENLRHIDVVPIVGTERERFAALRRDASVKTINYDNLVWLTQHYGDKWPFRTVVADESTKLKGFRLRQGGKRTQALGKLAHRHVKRFIELTGTPSPNGLKDLWGQAWFLDGGQRLGRTFTAFTQRWFQKSYDGYGSEPLDHAQREIQALLKDICITVEAKDWFDLKQPIVNDIYVDMPVKARQLYRDMEKKMFAEIEGIGVEALNAAARTQKCLQLANGAAYVDELGNWKEVHDEKIQALEDIIEEAAGAPVLCAYNFKSDLARITRAFPQARVLDARTETIRDWNAGKIPLLLAHPASAGHGLNLQDGGNILVFFSVNWNLEEHLQIIERIGPTRQLQAGYDRPVFIHRIIARDSVDELVLERLESKKEVQEILLAAMKRKGRV